MCPFLEKSRNDFIGQWKAISISLTLTINFRNCSFLGFAVRPSGNETTKHRTLAKFGPEIMSNSRQTAPNGAVPPTLSSAAYVYAQSLTGPG